MIQLRPYQSEALDAIVAACMAEKYLLLQAATGAGKTIMFSELIKRFMTDYQMRITICAHREVLVRQAWQKLVKVWPEGMHKIGLACASVSAAVDVQKPVVIGSPQTLVNRLGVMPPAHLLIIDECHRIPPRNEKSQYRELIERMEGYYPQMRVLGVTATPFRMGHGYIYGERCRQGRKNWFPGMNYSVSMSRLQEQGFLVPCRAKEAENIDDELAGVRTDKGEFNTRDLAAVMSREVHVGSAVRAYEQYGEGRRHVVVFCVTIEHAEKVAQAFATAGYVTGSVHSEMSKAERDRVLKEFDAGRIQVLCNVGVLTEGWDSTAVDCLLMCRPTMSAALYVQIIGRGLRPHPGKQDCLVLDLSGNCTRHGDPDNPRVIVPGEAKKKTAADGEAPGKVCPTCKTIVPALRLECPDCGHQFPRPEIVERHDDVALRDVGWAPMDVTVETVTAEPHMSKAGNRLMKVCLYCKGSSGTLPILANHFLDIEGQSGGYMLSRARNLWRRISGVEPPRTVDEALSRFIPELAPSLEGRSIAVKLEGKFYNVTRW